MPWTIEKRDNQHCVLDEDGKTVKCHPTAEAAKAHMKALYANVPDAKESERVIEYHESTLEAVGPPADFTGREWDVTIIGPKAASDLVSHDGQQFIRSKNGRWYSIKALEASVPLWNNVKVYDNHLTNKQFEEKQGMRSVASEWIGSIVNPRWDEAAKAIKGVLKLVDDGLARKLKAGWEQGILSTIGLSIDTLPETRDVLSEGRNIPVIEGFKRIFSVDLVAEPAAGGAFNRLIQAYQEAQMTQTGEVTQGLKVKLVDMPESATQDTATEAAIAQATEQLRKTECKLLLRDKLDEAKLPKPMRGLLEQQFGGRVFEADELDQTITRVREATAALDTSGRVTGAGNGRSEVSVGLDEKQKLEIEFLRLAMGNHDFRKLEATEDELVTERLTETYQDWKKSDKRAFGYRRMSEIIYDLLGGDPLADARAAEAVTTSGMSSIVKNTVNIMLAANYAQRERWWETIVRQEDVDTIDTSTLVRVYGLNTLSVVSEGSAYTEMSWADEEETATFVKKGNYVGVTMESLLAEKLNVIRQLPDRLASSWYNTLSSLVSAVFTTNTATGPALADTGALFNATAVATATGHANLLTAALSMTGFGAARTAMMKQTDQPLGAGRRLLIEPRYLLVPTDLETTALQIRNSEQIPGSTNNDINPYYNKFDIVVVPDWTDADNWALVGDPQRYPAILLILLRGMRTPQLFTADSETAGAMFTNDTLRYKVRLMTWRLNSTYDCAPVADFRPLHKSNV